jgi:hypothetical protein
MDIVDMNYVGFEGPNHGPKYPGISQLFKLADPPVLAGYFWTWEHSGPWNSSFIAREYKYLAAFSQKIPNPSSGVYASGIRDEADSHVFPPSVELLTATLACR